MSIRLSMMVAKASNNVIGRDNKLPWYLPNDLKYFKQVTFGKPVIMGRKTWESLKGPLPGRTNIVITRQPDYLADGAKVVATLDDAVAMAENVAFIEGQEEAVIMGLAAGRPSVSHRGTCQCRGRHILPGIRCVRVAANRPRRLRRRRPQPLRLFVCRLRKTIATRK